jgi:hypothetical protein
MQKMRLTMTDKTEIKQIIASLSDDDHAKIDKQVEMLCANMRPVLNMLESHKPDDYTKQPSNGLVKTTAIIRSSQQQLCGTYSDRA